MAKKCKFFPWYIRVEESNAFQISSGQNPEKISWLLWIIYTSFIIKVKMPSLLKKHNKNYDELLVYNQFFHIPMVKD